MAESRRVVTILFADVSGFTAMSEALDPEDVREIMNDCFALLSAEVYRQGGVVDKYIGDNVMALFGAVDAQEDDPAKAVAAALGMQAALLGFSKRLEKERGFALSMRIGVNTGLVVAGDVGSKEKSAFTVMGDAVNLASRIEHHCRPGEVWVSRATALAASGFEYEQQEPIAVKGKKDLQTFYHAVGKKAPSVQPFSGRSAELGVLNKALSGALAGALKVVTVSGEAGVGKTALIDRFLSQVHCRVLRSVSLPRDPDPYTLFSPLAQELGFTLPAEGAQAKAVFFSSVEKALRRAAAQAPLLLTLEDAHFADAGSWELLAFLLNSLGQLPLMLLVAFRPEGEKSLPWSSEGRIPVVLSPFSQADGVALIDEFLGANTLSKLEKETLARHSGGNAYFLTELLRNHVESGGKALRTPESVQGAVLARIDRLPEQAKLILQVASILGLEFSTAMLQEAEPSLALLPELLDDLEDRHYLETRGPGRLAFAHAIMQDACYESVLKERRRHYHRLIAGLWEQKGELGHAADHYYWCREPGKALSFNWEAGLAAERAFTSDRSLVFFQRCLELEPSPKVLARLGDSYSMVFEPDLALDCYLKCRELVTLDDPLNTDLYRKIGTVFSLRGEQRRAEEMFVAAALAQEGRPVTAQTLALWYEAATVFFRSGRNQDACDWIGRIIAHYKKEGLPLPVPEATDIYRKMPAFSHLVAK